MAEREAKPVWSAVPDAVQSKTEEMLGAGVNRAVRTFGGYGPSATLLLTLADGRRVFFKGTYPLPEGSEVRWMLEEEERVYLELGDRIAPWAPAFYGTFRVEGWHVLLMEAVGGARVPPWTESRARAAARSYAEFHARNLDQPLPAWLPRDTHLEFAHWWRDLASSSGLRDVAALAGSERRRATAWLEGNVEALAEAERTLGLELRRSSLLHFDTRSDNIRLEGDLLRIFDWPFACVGPPEFDLAAFAQSIESEGGPLGERTIAWYEEVLKVDRPMLDAAAAGIAGYFADRAPRPPLDGLPRLRSVQRRQLKASLGLAARLVGLPRPDWLESVPD